MLEIKSLRPPLINPFSYILAALQAVTQCQTRLNVHNRPRVEKEAGGCITLIRILVENPLRSGLCLRCLQEPVFSGERH